MVLRGEDGDEPQPSLTRLRQCTSPKYLIYVMRVVSSDPSLARNERISFRLQEFRLDFRMLDDHKT
jgi:hypothetical protein